LKADGSVDSNTYLTTSAASSTYLPLAGGTLTGALSGTSATFSGNLNLQGAVTRNINFYDSSNTNINAQIQYDQIASNSGQLLFGTNNAGTFATRLTIANTGAATFSSSVSITDDAAFGGQAKLFSRITADATTVGKIADSGLHIWNTTNVGSLSQITFGYTNGSTTNASVYLGYISTNVVGSGFGDFVLGTAPSANAQCVERMRITSGGNVGIGTSSPQSSYKLTISGTDTIFPAIYLENTTNSQSYSIRATGTGFFIRDNTSGNDRITIASGGQVGINTIDGGVQLAVKSTSTTSSSYPLFLFNSAGTGLFYVRSDGETYVSSLGTGAVTATSGVLSTTSDMNLKIEDGYINNALDKILKLNPRYFYWKEESGLPTDLRQLGFYAQEVNEALGEEVANTPKKENDKWGIYDRGMIAFLTKAIQEQQVQIEELKELIKNK
jgi:hypothetical protein